MLLCDLAMHAVWSQSEHEKVIFICTLMFLRLCILSVQTKKAFITTLSTPLVMPAAGSQPLSDDCCVPRQSGTFSRLLTAFKLAMEKNREHEIKLTANRWVTKK